jgi:hypothetical protein
MADKLKNLLLAVLRLLMAGLLALTFFVSIQGSRGGQRLLQTMDEGESLVIPTVSGASAQPEVLAVLQPNGVFLADDGQSYDVLYRQMEPLWQEALGSAGSLQPLTENDYLALLQPPVVLLQYHAAQPLYLLRAWGGSHNLGQDVEVIGLALTAREEQVILLATDRNGGRWKAETAASLADLESLCSDLPQSNSQFAGAHAVLQGDEVLTRQVGEYALMSCTAPELARRGELSETIQSLFGMNPYLTKVYPNADGSLVYVESHSTISLSPEGDFTYSGEGIPLEITAAGEIDRQAEICMQIYELLSHLWEQAGASGQLSLERVQFEGTRGTLCFVLHLNGRFVERSSGYWATATVEDGVITGVSAALRQLDETGSTPLLPLYHAAATLRQGKGSLRVRLLEQPDGMLQPQVCFVTEE